MPYYGNIILSKTRASPPLVAALIVISKLLLISATVFKLGGETLDQV